MSNLTTTPKSKLVLLIEEFQAFHVEYKKKAQEAFHEAVKEFFSQNPEVQMIHWTQFSPFFNDGDECVFSVHAVECSNSLDVDDFDCMGYELELTEDAEKDGKWIYPTWNEEREVPGFDELSSFINKNDDLMEELFGNHVQVIITREGIQINDYEHD